MRFLMVIFLLFCYACVTSGNVMFISRNFYNNLTWDAAPARVPGETVLYSVFYGVTDDELFHEKAECQNITELHCDLTSETPPDHDTYYRARVMANGKHHGTSRSFKPIAQTVLSAPILSYYTTNTFLHINVTLPLGPNDESIADIIRRNHKGATEAETVYILFMKEPIQTVQKTVSGHFEVSLRKDGGKYCGYVVYTPVHELGRDVSEEARFCAMPQGEEPMVLPWLVLIVAVVIALMLMAVCFAKRYMKNVNKDSIPLFLVPDVTPSPVIMHPKRVNISTLEISDESKWTVYATLKVNSTILSAESGDYAHKNTILFKEVSSTDSEGLQRPEPGRDDSAQSSDIYSTVTVVEPASYKNQTPPMSQENKLPQNRQLLSTIKTLSSEDSFESESQQLILPTHRDKDGQLEFNLMPLNVSHTFTGPSKTLDPPEKKSLLSYVIVAPERGDNFVSLHSLESSDCSDSGLDENTLPTPTQDSEHSPYLPAQPDLAQFSPSCESSDSGYKQNWMPFVQTYKTNYPWTWSGTQDDSA